MALDSSESEDLHSHGRKKRSQENRSSDSNSEQSLYDRHGNRKGYHSSRSHRMKSKSVEREDYSSPRVSKHEYGFLLSFYMNVISTRAKVK